VNPAPGGLLLVPVKIPGSVATTSAPKEPGVTIHVPNAPSCPPATVGAPVHHQTMDSPGEHGNLDFRHETLGSNSDNGDKAEFGSEDNLPGFEAMGDYPTSVFDVVRPPTPPRGMRRKKKPPQGTVATPYADEGSGSDESDICKERSIKQTTAEAEDRITAIQKAASTLDSTVRIVLVVNVAATTMEGADTAGSRPASGLVRQETQEKPTHDVPKGPKVRTVKVIPSHLTVPICEITGDQQSRIFVDAKLGPGMTCPIFLDGGAQACLLSWDLLELIPGQEGFPVDPEQVALTDHQGNSIPQAALPRKIPIAIRCLSKPVLHTFHITEAKGVGIEIYVGDPRNPTEIITTRGTRNGPCEVDYLVTQEDTGFAPGETLFVPCRVEACTATAKSRPRTAMKSPPNALAILEPS
jgi:hypothetical protein